VRNPVEIVRQKMSLDGVVSLADFAGAADSASCRKSIHTDADWINKTTRVDFQHGEPESPVERGAYYFHF
jgi:hypothetical protein